MAQDYRSIIPEIISRAGFIFGDAVQSVWGPSSAPVTKYVNRCWHYTNAEFIRWTTEDDPDPTGTSYPGPGTFGVDTDSPAVVESIIES